MSWQVHDTDQAPRDARKITACSRQLSKIGPNVHSLADVLPNGGVRQCCTQKVCQTCSDDEIASQVTVRFFNEAAHAESEISVIHVRDMRDLTN